MSDVLDAKLVEVGYFMARCGLEEPPAQLGAAGWKEAYAKFYSSLGNGKSETEFRNSLKNIRDHFDGHVQNTRQGWKDSHGNPHHLSASKVEVYKRLNTLDDDSLWRLVRPAAVLTFSMATAESKSEEFRKKGARFFSSEFSGAKSIRAKKETQFDVDHGLIVDELKNNLECANPDCLVFNNQKIDLALETSGAVSHVFEVKTKTDTQSIYTAIGQLYIHTIGLEDPEKVIVLPLGDNTEQLDDIFSALNVRCI